MSDIRYAPGMGIRRCCALVLLAGLVYASDTFAQIYKCTAADGRTAYSDKPCATPPSPAGSASAAKGGMKQESLNLPKPGVTGAASGTDAISAMCARYEGATASDSLIQSLPEMQRQTVVAALKGVITGIARGPGAQEAVKRVTLHFDASRNAIICVPQQRAQSSAAPPVSTYTAHRVEPNGRMETLQPGAQPLVSNDANEPQTVATRCAGMITSCVRSKTSGLSLDECFDKQPVCPAGRLDPALSCCPQACKDAYRSERARGTDAQSATLKVIFGDDTGAVSCIPGMPKKG